MTPMMTLAATAPQLNCASLALMPAAMAHAQNDAAACSTKPTDITRFGRGTG
jgi:hypothetical protein